MGRPQGQGWGWETVNLTTGRQRSASPALGSPRVGTRDRAGLRGGFGGTDKWMDRWTDEREFWETPGARGKDID